MIHEFKTLIIERDTLMQLLTMADCIESIDNCMRQTSAGNVVNPPRAGFKAGKGMLGWMPGYLGEPEGFACKLITQFPEARLKGYSSHSGVTVYFEAETGQPAMIVDSGYLTAVRTAAASAVATRTLARDNASTLALVGSGEQGYLHVAAMLAVRPITSIRIWGRSPENALRFAERIEAEWQVKVDIFATVAQTIKEADIICSSTPATAPVLLGRELPDGCHINAVGASRSPKVELDEAAVIRSSYYIDYRESAFKESRELMEALESGAITEEHVRGEIGEVLLGHIRGRENERDITLYRSVGFAAQDVAAAALVYNKARNQGLGLPVCF
jgi:ornithine cyclodeaminase